MSWSIIRICDRCSDAKMMDYRVVDIKKFSVNGRDYVLCDKCSDELREMNKSLDDYAARKRVEFFKGGVTE